jgi:hypothetical protein
MATNHTQFKYYVVNHTVPLILYCKLVVSPVFFKIGGLSSGTVIIKRGSGIVLYFKRTSVCTHCLLPRCVYFVVELTFGVGVCNVQIFALHCQLFIQFIQLF